MKWQKHEVISKAPNCNATSVVVTHITYVIVIYISSAFFALIYRHILKYRHFFYVYQNLFLFSCSTEDKWDRFSFFC